MKRILVWFKNDLRLRDHLPLTQALADAEEIIPFYCFEDKFYQESFFNLPKTGAARAQFILESLTELQSRIADLGSELQVYQGSVSEGIAEIHRQWPLDAIYCAEEVSREELESIDEIRSQGFDVRCFWNYSLYQKADLPCSVQQIPKVFTAWRKKMEKYSQVREPLAAPDFIASPPDLKSCSLPTLKDLDLEPFQADERAAIDLKGGEKRAWDRLQRYFWDQQLLQRYKETRNGLVGPDYSSKFSAWLSVGCISARDIYAEIKKFEKQVKKNSSTYWLYFELMWRDYFRFLALKKGGEFFRVPRDFTPKAFGNFEAWRQGKTGQDFVDANMRELLLTGFMSNRGRQNVASFLAHDLKEHWYAGAIWFESQLIDYDVCSNYGNWTYVSGVGNDPRENRWFNVAGQADRYDPDQSYRKLWLS